MTSATPAELLALERLLHAEIPLSRAMGVRVLRQDAHGLTLQAPLAPNINHKSTAFGGSLVTLATLAGWGLLQRILPSATPLTVVIQESHVHYRRPVTQDLLATCAMPAPAQRERLHRHLARKSMGRIDLDVTIPAGGEAAVLFHGTFVVFDKSGRAPD